MINWRGLRATWGKCLGKTSPSTDPIRVFGKTSQTPIATVSGIPKAPAASRGADRSSESESGSDWVAQTGTVLAGLTNRRETARDPATVELAESDARDLIAECRRLSDIAARQSALDNQRFIAEAAELADAARLLIGRGID